MTTATLSIDLNAIAANWQALNKMTGCDTGAVIKANAYGLGIDRVAPVLAAQGARKFFVAVAEEGVALRRVLGPGPAINVFAGHMPGDADMIRSAALTPMINSVDQMIAHVEALPGHRFGVQLNSGMNRLGMDPAEWAALRDIALAQNPTLIMSHLACADEPNHPMNARQLKTFREMTDGLNVPRSLAATGGIMLGRDYHFDLTRPGIGVYGGLPFADAMPVVTLDVPVIQVREVATGRRLWLRLDGPPPDIGRHGCCGLCRRVDPRLGQRGHFHPRGAQTARCWPCLYGSDHRRCDQPDRGARAFAADRKLSVC